MLVNDNESFTYQYAMSSSESKRWLAGSHEIWDKFYIWNQAWTLVDPPEWLKPIGCKWIFEKKIDMDGNVHAYKAWLVAKDFKKNHDIDYDETFSLVDMVKSIRILLAIIAYYDYEI